MTDLSAPATWVLDPAASDVTPGTKNPIITKLMPKGEDAQFTQAGTLTTGATVADTTWHLELTSTGKYARLGAIVIDAAQGTGSYDKATFACTLVVKGTQVSGEATGSFSAPDAVRRVFAGKVVVGREGMRLLADALLAPGHPARAAVGMVGSLVLELHSEYIAS